MSELLFYEDAPVGLSFDTDGMVVTESHVVQFAGLSGDFFPLHMDDEFARSVFQLLRDFNRDDFQGFARLRADLLLFRDVQQNLHPFKVFGNGHTAMMLGNFLRLGDLGCNYIGWRR